MSKSLSELSANLDPSLKAYVDALVEERVSASLEQMRLDFSGIQAQLNQIKADQPIDKVSILVSSHELDKLLPAFIIATGAASFGMEVDLFFTLWGILGLKEKNTFSDKSIPQIMMSMMTPSNPADSGISRMNMMGAGSWMMKGMMKAQNVASISELIQLATDMGVKLTACQMTMGIMGVKKEELRSDVTYGGVATYIEAASNAKITLLI